MIQIGSQSEILVPVLVLVIWTLVMLVWMAATRLPAMTAAKMDPQEGARTSELGTKLPAHVQSKADNYNHLLEQPTMFYAVCLLLAVAGLGEGLNLILAWVYVGSRVVHSVIQATSNVVPIRFGVFLVGTAALLVMAVNGLFQLIG